jgi:hypothetical protein
MNLTYLRIKGKVKGLFQSPIPYTPLLEDGDSSKYFGTYSGQRYGTFDTDCCWDFSGVNVAETRLMIYWKLNLIPQDTKDWLIANKYCDINGEPDLSDRWVAILSGVKDNGNYQMNFWNIASQVGLIPSSMLDYDASQAFKYTNKSDFNNDYFNPAVITPEMRAMGKEFLKRFTIQAEMIKGGYFNDINVELQSYLKEGSMQIGIPVPQDGSWNRVNVTYPVGRTQADHAVELFKFDTTSHNPFGIFDTYNPNPKNLSLDYYIPYITRISIKPIPVTIPVTLPTFQPTWMSFWMNAIAWLQGKPLPFPSTPLG